MIALTQKLHFPFTPANCGRPSKRPRGTSAMPPVNAPPSEPMEFEPPIEPEEPGDPDEFEVPCTDDGYWDKYWDVFIPDDDQYDPLPEPGDFANDEFPNDE